METEINTPKFANGHTTDSVVALFKRMAEENQDYHYSFFSPETERMMNNKILYTNLEYQSGEALLEGH